MKKKLTELRITSMRISIEARIAFTAFIDSDDNASLVIGGVEGLEELFTWLALTRETKDGQTSQTKMTTWLIHLGDS